MTDKIAFLQLKKIDEDMVKKNLKEKRYFSYKLFRTDFINDFRYPIASTKTTVNDTRLLPEMKHL